MGGQLPTTWDPPRSQATSYFGHIPLESPFCLHEKGGRVTEGPGRGCGAGAEGKAGTAQEWLLCQGCP